MKTIQISNEFHAQLKAKGAKNMEAAIKTMSDKTPKASTTGADTPTCSSHPDNGSTSDILDTVRRIEARIKGQDEINKKILDRTAKLEEVYIEMSAKMHGGK